MGKTEFITLSIEELLQDWSRVWSGMAGSCPHSAVFLDPVAISAACKSSLIASPAACMACVGGQPQAIALFGQGRLAAGGITLGTLQSINMDMFGRYEFLHGPGHEAALEKLWEHILTAGRWDSLQFQLMPAGSRSLAVGRAVAARLRWRVHLEQQFASPWRSLPRDVPEWDAGLKAKFKSNLRNREGRIGRLGRLGFEVVADAERLPAALDAFYRLESAGWKGQEQSAIVQKPQVKSFYDHLVLESGGSASIAVLSLDDSPIAAQLLRVLGDRLYVVKVGYDPEYSKYSPGQLIMSRTLRHAIESGLRELDFLGEEATWKSDWDVIPDPNTALKLYAPGARGAYAYLARHGIRKALKRVPGARSLARTLGAGGRRP